VTTNHLALDTSGGLSLTREWSSSLDDPAENNLEARFDASFSLFFYDSPKTDLRLQAAVIPNLTTEGRVRFELDTTLRYELITDLFLELSYYESQDNEPPAGASGKVDRGIVFSLGWSK
jgi:hypothetical protein